MRSVIVTVEEGATFLSPVVILFYRMSLSRVVRLERFASETVPAIFRVSDFSCDQINSR